MFKKKKNDETVEDILSEETENTPLTEEGEVFAEGAESELLSGDVEAVSLAEGSVEEALDAPDAPAETEAVPQEASDAAAFEETAPLSEEEAPTESAAEEAPVEDATPASQETLPEEELVPEKECVPEDAEVPNDTAASADPVETEEYEESDEVEPYDEEAAPAETSAPIHTPLAISQAAPTDAPTEDGAKPNNTKSQTGGPKGGTYTWQEKRLRRKYKMDKDELLSSNDVISGFILARGEQVVRTYHCLAAAKGPGTICLTNKRLLVNADERSEVSVEQVSGIKFSRYALFSVGKFIFALLLTAIAVFCVLLPTLEWNFSIPNITGDDRKMWAEILCYVGAGLSFLISLPLWFTLVRKTFYFYIFAHQDAPFIACKNAGYSKREKKGKVAAFMVASAGKESEKAARELGALIIEIKEGRFRS